MGLRIGFIKTIFGMATKKTVQETAKVSQRMTKVLTDSSTGIVCMERNINRNGKNALARLEVLPNGSRKLTIEGGGDNTIWRTTNITREKGTSAFGGDTITVDKDYTKYWCHNTKTTLVKEYSPSGVLEHKDLTYNKNVGNEVFINHKATQDRVYNEVPLNHSVQEMLNNPYETRNIKHSLDSKNNYGNFADGIETNYSRAVTAREQAAIEATKKAEAEALAAKQATEKAAAELRASRPRINTSKALGKNIEELTLKETKLADGTIEKIYTDPKTGKVLAKTHDLGILHKEWIYGNKADMIYMKQVGKDKPYIVAKKGNYTQLSYEKDCNYSPSGKEYLNEQYYNDGSSYLQRGCSSTGIYNDAKGCVTVFDSTAADRRAEFTRIAKDIPDYPKVRIYQNEAMHHPYAQSLTNAQIQANKYLKELDADAKHNFINFEDLFSGYVG